MGNWHRIREVRSDLTDYVVHLTRLVVDTEEPGRTVRSGLARLKEILRSGYLKPTTAPRVTVQKNRNHTVRGPYPAVCFSEQPLEQFHATLGEIDGASYQPYGIAFNKIDLHNYGGRPVIYGDEDILHCLTDELKYLWVRYRPIRPKGLGYPNDFTWEREWRCRIAPKDALPWEHSLKGVPLLLPDDFLRVAKEVSPNCWLMRRFRYPDFRIIVKLDSEVQVIRDFLKGLTPKPESRAYFPIYVAAAKRAQVISLEHVKRRLSLNDKHYVRIEDLDSPEKRQNIIPVKKLAPAKQK